MLQAAPIKKDQNLIQPVSGDLFITWGDISQINWKLNGVFASVIVWFCLQIWESYKKSKDDTKERLERIEKAVEKISERLQHTPTFRDLHNERE